MATTQCVLEWGHGEGNLLKFKANDGITKIYKPNHLSGFQSERSTIRWAAVVWRKMLCWCHGSKVRMGRQVGDHRGATVHPKTTCRDHGLNGSISERTTTPTHLTTGHFVRNAMKIVHLSGDQTVTENERQLFVMTEKSGVWPSALLADLPHSPHHSSGCFPAWWARFNSEIKSDTPSLDSVWASQDAPPIHTENTCTLLKGNEWKFIPPPPPAFFTFVRAASGGMTAFSSRSNLGVLYYLQAFRKLRRCKQWQMLFSKARL